MCHVPLNRRNLNVPSLYVPGNLTEFIAAECYFRAEIDSTLKHTYSVTDEGEIKIAIHRPWILFWIWMRIANPQWISQR